MDSLNLAGAKSTLDRLEMRRGTMSETEAQLYDICRFLVKELEPVIIGHLAEHSYREPKKKRLRGWVPAEAHVPVPKSGRAI